MPPLPAKVNLEIIQGDEFNKSWTYKPDGVTPFDWTGYTARAQARRAYDSTPELDLSSAGGQITLNNVGQVKIVISATSTKTLEPQRLMWDLKVTPVSGATWTLMEGNVTVKQAVTQ